MWTKHLKQFFRVTRSERAQGVLEYLLVVAVIMGIVLVFAKPFMASLSKNLGKSFTTGFFAVDGSGSGFYTFSIK